MKVGRASWMSDVEVPLPSEIIEFILAFVGLQSKPDVRQRQLWACCLISKQWYSLTVPLLYHTPLLNGRNFSEFARTMCPPVNARRPMIGLEDCIHHLDMGILAYEPQKSTTARLIRRTKQSLETFVAPAVSFSITCLAPLSRCANLKVLDLSRDAYDFKLSQLMSSTRNLNGLWYLSLPKTIIGPQTEPDEFVRWKKDPKAISAWPKNLTHLVLSYGNPTSIEVWNAFLSSWPASLYSLSLIQCEVFPFQHLTPYKKHPALEQITNLTMESRGKPPAMLLSEILVSFPNTRVLEVSAVTRWLFHASFSGHLNNLEHVYLRYSPDFVALHHITPDYLLEFVNHCESLIRIDAPEAYVDFDQDPEGTTTDQMNDIIERRVKSRAENGKTVRDFGVYLVEIQDTGTGLKRSLQYPEG